MIQIKSVKFISFKFYSLFFIKKINGKHVTFAAKVIVIIIIIIIYNIIIII